MHPLEHLLAEAKAKRMLGHFLHAKLEKLPIATFKGANDDAAFLAGKSFVVMLWGGPEFMFVLNGNDQVRAELDALVEPKNMSWDVNVWR